MAKKKFDPKAKAKRQKIIAAAGGVLLLGLLAFQVPRTMKMLNPPATEAPAPVAAPTTLPTADPSVLPTPGTSGGTATAPAGGGAAAGLISSDAAPPAQAGQLIAFGRFTSKDPFKQQVDPDALQNGGGSTSGGGKKGGSSPSTSGSQPAVGGGGGGVVQPVPGASGPSVAAGSALISVNGAEEIVAAKADFPKDEPVFTLVSIGRGEVKIAIAGGALASGAPTMTLKKGKAVTLVNTADGTRYELELVSVA
jgi:hypothetical protein